MNNKNYINIKSYVRVSVFGSYVEVFIDFLRQKSIRIWDTENLDGIIYFKCKPNSYPAIVRFARSYGLRTKPVNRHGAYFKLVKYKKRYGIVLGVINFFLIITVMSNFVWDIRVIGNETITEQQITEQINLNGISSGTYIKGYNPAAIELSLKLELDRLAWINIERSGSRVNVKVSESLLPKKAEIPVSEPCNVIASHTGRIISTEVYRGKLLLEKGSGVGKGDIIVSGIVEDGGGNNLLQHADAKIIAECEESAEIFAPFTVREKKNNGKTLKKDYFIFLGNTYPLFLNNADLENVRYSEELRKPTFFGLSLPFKIKTGIYNYYDEIDITYSSDETMERLKKQVDIYKQNFFREGEIISFNTEFLINESGINAKVKVVYQTDIALKKEVYN